MKYHYQAGVIVPFAQKHYKQLILAVAAIFMASMAMLTAVSRAAATTVVVTPSNNQGWVFNGDPDNATPYEFNEDQASIGEGSLFVEPLSSEAARKFIAIKDVDSLVADFDSVSYDYLIAGDGVESDAVHFYLNVYTNFEGSTTFYDCRFDYVPTLGSTTDFTTASFTSADTPTAVGDRADAIDCPDTLAEMPEGSTVSFIALNVGDTSVNDEGLAGYLDNVVLTVGEDVTTFDFEADPTVLGSKDECKNGGWMESEAPVFSNQGQCVSHFASNGVSTANRNKNQ